MIINQRVNSQNTIQVCRREQILYNEKFKKNNPQQINQVFTIIIGSAFKKRQINSNVYILNYVIIIFAVIILVYGLTILHSRTDVNKGKSQDISSVSKLMKKALQYLFYVPSEQKLATNNQFSQGLLAGDPKNMAYRLYISPEDHFYQQLQYFHYNEIYNFSSYSEQSLCLVITDTNSQKNEDDYRKLFASINRQNYWNYHLKIYTQNKYQQIKDILQDQFPDLSEKTKIISNYKYGVYQAKNYLIRHYCKKYDIIIDFSANGVLIGRSVFDIINQRYHTNPGYSLIYFNSISVMNGSLTKAITGSVAIEQLFNLNNFIKLKSYKSKYYNSIPQQQFKPLFNNTTLDQKQLNIYFYSILAHNQNLQNISFIDEFVYFSNQAYLNQQSQYSKQLLQKLKQLTFYSSGLIDVNCLKYLETKGNLTYYKFQQINNLKEIVNKKQPKQLYSQEQINKMMDDLIAARYPTLKKFLSKKIRIKDEKFLKKAKIAYNLYRQPSNQLLALGENHYFKSQYPKLNDLQEKPFCIVADGMVISMENTGVKKQFSNEVYTSFLESVGRMDYTNFKLVITITNSRFILQQNQVKIFLESNYPILFSKTTILTTTDKLPNGRSKNNMIKNYCSAQDYVIPVQLDCQFIGRKPLKLLNYFLWQDLNTNLLYTDHFLTNGQKYYTQPGILRTHETSLNKQYDHQSHILTIRKQKYYQTFYLFTFKKPLYDQIKVRYLCPTETICHKQSEDAFIFKAVSNLANKKVVFKDQILFYLSVDNLALWKRGDMQTLDNINPLLFINSPNIKTQS